MIHEHWGELHLIIFLTPDHMIKHQIEDGLKGVIEMDNVYFHRPATTDRLTELLISLDTPILKTIAFVSHGHPEHLGTIYRTTHVNLNVVQILRSFNNRNATTLDFMSVCYQQDVNTVLPRFRHLFTTIPQSQTSALTKGIERTLAVNTNPFSPETIGGIINPGIRFFRMHY